MKKELDELFNNKSQWAATMNELAGFTASGAPVAKHPKIQGADFGIVCHGARVGYRLIRRRVLLLPSWVIVGYLVLVVLLAFGALATEINQGEINQDEVDQPVPLPKSVIDYLSDDIARCQVGVDELTAGTQPSHKKEAHAWQWLDGCLNVEPYRQGLTPVDVIRKGGE